MLLGAAGLLLAYGWLRTKQVSPFDWLWAEVEKAKAPASTGGAIGAAVSSYPTGTIVQGSDTLAPVKEAIADAKAKDVPVAAGELAYYIAIKAKGQLTILVADKHRKTEDAAKAILTAWQTAGAEAGWYITEEVLDSAILVGGYTPSESVRRDWVAIKGVEGWIQYFGHY